MMAGSDHHYNTDFYDYISHGSRCSADVVVPLVRGEVRADSVLDIGAGNGSWLASWLSAGIADAMAIDGEYVDTSRLAVPRENFRAFNLSGPFDMERRYDLVQSLEVAEHIPLDCADVFVDSLCRHGDVILFSAANRHQGGEFHVNEQPPEYWRRKFAARGFDCFDWLRPSLAGCKDVKPWYRYNMVMYANADGMERLSGRVVAARVPQTVKLAGRGDLAWEARRMAVALIPQRGVHAIARVKAAVEARAHRRQA